MLPILLALLLQDPAQSAPTPAPAPAPKAAQPESEAESGVYDEESLIQELAKQGVTLHKGPYTGELGPQAQVQVPEGCFFADGDSTRKFLELSQNIAGGDELGMILCLGSETAPSWSAYFSFSADGYIKDNEEIDAVRDLRPLCSNCHTIIHRRQPALTIDELRALLRRASV